MMEFKFDLQMFALDLTSATVTLEDSPATSTTTLYAGKTGKVYSTSAAAAAGDTEATMVLTVSPGVSGASFDGSKVTKITVLKATTGDVTLNNSATVQIVDPNKDNVFATSGSNKFKANSATVKGTDLTAFTGLEKNAGIVSIKSGSGTLVLGSTVTATASNVTAGFDSTDYITGFSAGTITVPSDTTDGKIDGVTITAAGTYTGGEYITAKLSGAAGQTLDLDNATKAFKVTGTGYADILATSDDKADTIDGGAGTDTITVKSNKTVSINGGAGKDTIKGTAGVIVNTDSSILGGAGDDSIDFSQAITASSNVLFDGGEGNDEIKINNAANKITNSTVLGGAGKDTIYSTSETNVLTGGADTDVYALGDAALKANISDYRFGEDIVSVSGADAGSNARGLVTAGSLETDGNTGRIAANGNDGAATITSSTGYFAVTLQDTDKNKVALGWVGENATNINASSLTTPVVLTGKTNTAADLLIGGAKADTLYAGAGDSIYGGAGKDNLSMDANTYGVYVGIATNSGADTVQGFTTGFDIDSADAIYLVDGSSSTFGASYDGTDLTVTNGSASMSIAGAKASGAGNDATDLLVSGQKVVVAKNGGTIKTDDITYANYWIGTYDSTTKTGSAADLSDVTDAVNVNLGDTDHIRYIYTVTGGAGNTTLMGGNNAERLIAASGSNTSLYGGAGKDTLVSSADTKTEFFFMNGAGNDEIVDFTTGTDTDASDVLNFYGSALGSISRTDTNVVKVKTSDGSTLSVNQKDSSADGKLQWVSGEAKGVAKIANASGGSLSYETDVTNYFGSSKKDTLAVGAGDGTDVNIWLDGSQGVSYSDIDVVDASGRAANTTIAGSAIAETITGGSGNASVWGGAGQVADVLRSTNGSMTTFFYGLGNGSDNISGYANDTVNLFDVKLSDIASANIQNSQVIFTTSSKDTVTVSGAQTFQLADGSRWTANYSNNQWESAQ